MTTDMPSVKGMTLRKVAELVGGELVGDGERVVESAAGLGEAGPEDLSYLADKKLEGLLATTKAGAVLLEASRKGEAFPYPVVFVADPKRAFNAFLRHLEAYVQPKRAVGHHPTAVISPYARIGRDVHVGPHAVIEAGAFVGDRTKVSAQCYIGHGASVGKDCMLYPQVVIRERCSVGDRVILHPGVVIGADGFGYLSSPQGHEKVPQIGRVELGDDVEVGANSTIDRATTGVTRIGKGTKIDNLVQIGHNVQMGEHNIIVAQVGVGGSAELGPFVVLGGQAGVGDHVKLGAGTQAGGQTGLNANTEPGAILFGTPARPFRESFKLQALINKLPEIYDFVKKLQKERAKTEAPAS